MPTNIQLESKVKSLEKTISSMERSMQKMEGMLSGNGQIINSGKRLEIDKSVNISQLLNRISKIEKTEVVKNQSYFDLVDNPWSEEDADNALFPSTITRKIGINTKKPSTYLDVNGDAHIVENLEVDANVGIGVTPSTKLDVAGHISHNADNQCNYFGADNDAGITYNGTNMAFDSSGNYIFENGNVGIGISPSVKLDVAELATNCQSRIRSYSDTVSHAPVLGLYKSHSDTLNIVETINNDLLGSIQFVGVDAAPGFRLSAKIECMQIGASTAGRVPADIVFSTESSSESTREAVRIDKDANVLVQAKVAFTQIDLNEYIDSLADGYMDYGATTGHRFRGGNVGIGVTTPSAVLNLKAGTAAAGTSPLKFTDGVALATPELGAVEFYDNRFWITNVDTQRAIDRSDCVKMSTTTVANTTSETEIFNCSIAADSLAVGNLFKVIAVGVASNASAADILTIRVKVGGVTVITIVNSARNFTNDDLHINAIATQRTLGVTGSRAVHFDLSIGGDTSAVNGVATIDTTSNMDVSITAQWNNAKAGNTMSLYQGIMEFKN